jgi:hypothetical protein
VAAAGELRETAAALIGMVAAFPEWGFDFGGDLGFRFWREAS